MNQKLAVSYTLSTISSVGKKKIRVDKR